MTARNLSALEASAGWTREALVANGVRLAELGFGIVRVYHPLDRQTCSCEAGRVCPSIGKHPVGDDWQKRAQQDPERVRRLLSNPGNRSYGIVPPPGVFGWDLDKDAPTKLRELAISHGPLPLTRVHRSGQGHHSFYRWPDDVPGAHGNLLGVVTRWAPGGMVVGPGSIHASTGRLYAVERDVPIAELPDAWARMAVSWSDAQHAAQDGAEPGDAEWGIEEGARHPFLVRAAARLRSVGLRGEALADALLALNAERCVPPKSEPEVRELAAYYQAKADDRGGGPYLVSRASVEGSGGPASRSNGTADEPPPEADAGPEAIPSDGTATVQPPDLARQPRILDLAADAVAGMGLAGERRAVALVYLVITTRLLERIVSLAVKGPSSAGKSFLVECVIRLFPPSAYYAFSAMSERALIYDETPLAHRMLVIYEATGMAGDVQTYIVRSLLSEGRVRYVTVEKVKGGLRSRTIERQGPTGLITTTTELRLHPENETRLLSLTVSDTAEQTRAILLAHAAGAPAMPDLAPWHALQAWLGQDPPAVVVPYASTLAGAIPPVAVRLRRDFPAVLALIRAHALLHQLSRPLDDEGAILATIADYAVVRDLVADLVADAAERAVPVSVRETVEAVSTLTLAGGETTVVAVAQALGIDKSSASRRVRSALDRGYLRNLEDRRGRPSRLVLGDPLPAEQAILPAPLELERLHGCSAPAGDSADDGPDPAQPANDDGWAEGGPGILWPALDWSPNTGGAS